VTNKATAPCGTDWYRYRDGGISLSGTGKLRECGGNGFSGATHDRRKKENTGRGSHHSQRCCFPTALPWSIGPARPVGHPMLGPPENSHSGLRSRASDSRSARHSSNHLSVAQGAEAGTSIFKKYSQNTNDTLTTVIISITPSSMCQHYFKAGLFSLCQSLISPILRPAGLATGTCMTIPLPHRWRPVWCL
jgi:hypothetical protein